MLFFQVALLAGYAYAHALTSAVGRAGRRRSFTSRSCSSAFAVRCRSGPPRPSELEPGPGRPGVLLGWLARAVGLPFFAVAATAPLLQRWFAATGAPVVPRPLFPLRREQRRQPRRAGRLSALGRATAEAGRAVGGLGRGASRSSRRWSAVCAVVTVIGGRELTPHERRPCRPATPATDLAAWVVLALVPSSLMLGVTTYLTTDLAAIPLLWVVPLALYLLSFVVAFGPAAEWSVSAGGAGLAVPGHGPGPGAGGGTGAAVLDPAPPGDLLRGGGRLPRRTGAATADGRAVDGVLPRDRGRRGAGRRLQRAGRAGRLRPRSPSTRSRSSPSCLVLAVGRRAACASVVESGPAGGDRSRRPRCSARTSAALADSGARRRRDDGRVGALGALVGRVPPPAARPVRADGRGLLLAASAFTTGVSGRVILRGGAFSAS